MMERVENGSEPASKHSSNDIRAVRNGDCVYYCSTSIRPLMEVDEASNQP